MERRVRDYRLVGGRGMSWRKRTPRRTPRKSIPTRESLAEGVRFEFRRRTARIDWRTLHTIDVESVIHDVDIDTLESVLDTVAFGNIQGEDIRHFTESNFVKIFRLAQLMVEYLLHVQDLLTDHKTGLLQSRANMEEKSERIRSRFLGQRDALLQTRHELKEAKRTLKTYEVMLKVHEKNDLNCHSNKPQVWHCSSCEKAFESSYYLDMHVARKHESKQEMTDDKILALVTSAEESTAARVKAETSFAVQTEIQKLRERYEADLHRAETNSKTHVRTLQEDLKQSNNQLREVQTRVEVLQAQILSNPTNNSRHEHAVEKSKEKCHGPNQERLYDLESKFSGLDRQVKTLGQENSRLLKELNVAYAEVSDLQFTKRQSAFALEKQIDDLREENQQLRKTMSKIEDKNDALSEERQGCSPRERWTDKDEALRVLARPPSRRWRTEGIREESSEGEFSPDPKHDTHSSSPIKQAIRFRTPERMSTPFKERPKAPLAMKKIKLRGGGDNPTTVEEMRAKLEREMAATHEEQKKRQKAVQQLLARELVKENRKIGKQTRSKDRSICMEAIQHPYPSKSDAPSQSIAPLLLSLPNKPASIRPKSTIHTVRTIVSNRLESDIPIPEPRVLPFHIPPPYKPGPCCKRPLHPYLRRGIGNPLIRPPPRPSLHMAVLCSNPDMKNVPRNRIPSHTVAPSKEHIITRLGAITQELGKYFPPGKPKLKFDLSPGSAQPTSHELETTETETIETEEDEAENRTSPEDEDIPRQQEVSKVVAMDVGDVGHTIRERQPETATETETDTQDKITIDFSGHLRKELKKFGIESSTNGISDTTYKSISSALEMQRSVRMSQIHGNERQIVEYERDSVAWHTQMAVRDLDLVVVKSPFNILTDSGSDQSNASDSSVDEFGRSGKKSYKSGESREDSKDREMKGGGTSDVRSSEQSSPISSETSDDINIQETHVSKSQNVNWAKNLNNVHLGPRSPPPEGRVQYVSRTHSWEPTLKQAKPSRNRRDPPSRGELIRSRADVVDNTRQSEEEEVEEDTFGLGDWDSDEDKEKQKEVHN